MPSLLPRRRGTGAAPEGFCETTAASLSKDLRSIRRSGSLRPRYGGDGICEGHSCHRDISERCRNNAVWTSVSCLSLSQALTQPSISHRKNCPHTTVYNQCANIVLRYAVKSHARQWEGSPPLDIEEKATLPAPPTPEEIDCIVAGFPWYDGPLGERLSNSNKIRLLLEYQSTTLDIEHVPEGQRQEVAFTPESALLDRLSSAEVLCVRECPGLSQLQPQCVSGWATPSSWRNQDGRTEILCPWAANDGVRSPSPYGVRRY